MNLEPGNRDACLVGPIAGVETLGDQNPGIAVRRAKPKARSAGIVRKIIQVTRMIVVLIAWQFPGSL